MSDLSERINDELEYQGLSRMDLARTSGINESTIRNWATTEPKASALYKVSKALEVPIEYLITGENPEQYISRLTPEEEQIIADYRILNEAEKTAVRGVLASFRSKSAAPVSSDQVK